MSENLAATEDKELRLVDNLELRIALTDSEGKLETLLFTYLCPLLLKLKSPHQRVRDKVSFNLMKLLVGAKKHFNDIWNVLQPEPV